MVLFLLLVFRVVLFVKYFLWLLLMLEFVMFWCLM